MTLADDLREYSPYAVSVLLAIPSFAFAWHVLVTRRSYADEPPLEAGWIPWLGAGLQMRKMEKFALTNYKKHGLTFAAYAAGQRFVFSEDLAVHRSVVSSKDFGANQIMVRKRACLSVSCLLTGKYTRSKSRSVSSVLSARRLQRRKLPVCEFSIRSSPADPSRTCAPGFWSILSPQSTASRTAASST